MADEGARAQGLSIEELQERLNEIDNRTKEIVETHQPNEPGAQQYLEEIVWRTIHGLHYDDALLVKLPLDRTIYDDAFSRARSLRLSERAIVYLEGLIQHFPKAYDIGTIFLQLAASQTDLAGQYEQLGMDERTKHFVEMADANIRKAIATDNAPIGHIMLAELLMNRRREEEAVAELQLAKSLTTDRVEEAQIEFHFAAIAMQQKKYNEALEHFKRVAEINPNYEGIWLNIGLASRQQGNFSEAEVYFKRALEAQSRDPLAYAELGALYLSTREANKALEIVEQGLRYNPGFANLHALLAAVYLDKGDRRRAQAALEEAERINPNLEIVQAVRDILQTKRK
jgi:tetratricopeptide (TPR) repeat protein